MVLLFLIWDFIFNWKSDIIVYAHCDILFIFLFFCLYNTVQAFLLPENGVKMAKFLFVKLVNNDYLY